MDDKVYQSEIIVENPFPGETSQSILFPTQTDTKQLFTQTTNKEKTFPKKRTAVELLSTALNTRSKKILQEFKLEQFGGLKVGDFKEGISGDLRITPNGITARDISGLTTFAIDGATGDAIFVGQIRGGSIISDTTLEGNDITGGSININDNFTVDQEGNVTIGVPSSVATGISPSLKMYNDEGALVGELTGDVAIAEYMRYHSVAFSDLKVYDDALNLTGLVAKINNDEGILMSNSRPVTLQGTGAGDLVDAPADGGASLFVNQSGGKDRLMVRFNSGASQQIAIEP